MMNAMVIQCFNSLFPGKKKVIMVLHWYPSSVSSDLASLGCRFQLHGSVMESVWNNLVLPLL